MQHVHHQSNWQQASFRITICCKVCGVEIAADAGSSEKKEKGCPTEAYMNPLKCPLPKAPSMTFYCMYGVGAPAERGYNYLKLETDEVSHDSDCRGQGGWVL